jgi:hypothetical protein
MSAERRCGGTIHPDGWFVTSAARVLLVVIVSLAAGRPAPASAAFLLTPRIATAGPLAETRLLGTPPGFELLSAPVRWGAHSVRGPSGSEIDAHVAGVASVVGALRTQLTLSTLGTSFYRESRLALAAVTRGTTAFGFAIDARTVGLDGRRSGAAAGLGALVRSRRGVAEGLLALGPSGVWGSSRLFPRAWELGGWLRSDARWAIGARAVGRGDASPGVILESHWSRTPWALRFSLDLDRGSLSVMLAGVDRVAGVATIDTQELAGTWLGLGVHGVSP